MKEIVKKYFSSPLLMGAGIACWVHSHRCFDLRQNPDWLLWLDAAFILFGVGIYPFFLDLMGD